MVVRFELREILASLNKRYILYNRRNAEIQHTYIHIHTFSIRRNAEIQHAYIHKYILHQELEIFHKLTIVWRLTQRNTTSFKRTQLAISIYSTKVQTKTSDNKDTSWNAT